MKAIKPYSKYLTLALFFCQPLYAQQIDQKFSGIEEIEISTGASDCVLQKGSDNQVNVKLEHTYGDHFKPTVEKSGSRLRIRESHRGSSNGNGTWTLTIPDGLEVDFNTGSGDFQATDIALEELELNAGSGDFSLMNISGEVESNAGSGDLEVEQFEGALEANAGSGDLEVTDASGEIQLNCGSGDISIDKVAGGIEANVGSGDIEADNLRLAQASSFNSGSGDVEVELSGSLESNISVNSGSGDAVLDFNGNQIDGVVVMTANKKNGEIHAPFPFDKEEEIDNNGHTTLKKTAKLGSGSVEIRVGTGSGEARINQ